MWDNKRPGISGRQKQGMGVADCLLVAPWEASWVLDAPRIFLYLVRLREEVA